MGVQPVVRWGMEFGVVMRSAVEYEKSIAEYPNIKPGQAFDGYRA